MGVVADDHTRPGFEDLVCGLYVLRPGSGRVFDAPVNGNYQKIALGAGLPDGFEDCGFVRSRCAAGLIGIGEEVHMGLVGLIGVAVAVEPTGHAQPAYLDAVRLGDDGLPVVGGVVAGAGEEHSFVAEMLAGLGESSPTLVHDVVVGEGDDPDAAGLEGFNQGDWRVEHERF